MNPVSKTEIRWFIRQLRPLLPAHLLGVMLIVLSSLLFLLDPLLIKWLIDVVLPKRDVRLLVTFTLGFLAVYALRLGCGVVARLVTFRTVQKLALRIRREIFNKMNRLSADYHESTSIGDKLYRMEQDVDQVAELGSGLVPSLLQTAVNTVFVVTTMAILNFRLTCTLLPLLPAFFVLRKYFERRLRFSSETVQERASDESNFLQEHLDHILQVQLLNQEHRQAEAFTERAEAKIQSLNRRVFTEAMFGTCYMGVISLGAVGILGYGGYQVFIGRLTVGGLVAFYSYLVRLFDPLNVAVDAYSRLARLGASIRRIGEVIQRLPGIKDSLAAIAFPPTIEGNVELRDVDFSYRAGLAILDRLNLRVAAGERVALVGSSGCGKSTLTKLMVRIYDPTQGSVEIDGMDIRMVRLESLRSRVCYLMQDVILFDRSLKENLLLGKPDATNPELNQAIEMADLTSLLERLPRGWDTAVGPRGSALSGGERQRVAIARAVLQNPSVLVLDESTSALDLPSEQRIFRNLSRHISGTIIFISHRLSALAWVDRFVVLAGGSISEQGTHQELILHQGPYHRLYHAQSEGALALTLPREPVKAFSDCGTRANRGSSAT